MTRSSQILCAALLALLPLACAPQAPQGKRTLLLWGLSPGDQGFQAVVDRFEVLHPDVHVKVLNLGAGGMNPQKLMTSIVGKVPPDLVYQDRFTIADWASRGAFMALDPLIAKGHDVLTPNRGQYYASAWDEASYKGSVYGIPTRGDDRALYYNKRLFLDHAQVLKAAGLDPSRPPRTWSELLAYSKALTSRDTLGFVPTYGNSWLYLYALQNDGSFLSNDGRTCTLAAPESQEALAFMKRGYEIVGGYERSAVLQTAGLDKENDPFMKGQVAMKIDGDWILGDLARYAPTLNFGVAPAPVPDDRLGARGRFKGEKEPYITWSGGQCYSIPVGSRNVDDAWNFIKWACSKDAALVAARAEASGAKRAGRVYIPQ